MSSPIEDLSSLPASEQDEEEFDLFTPEAATSLLTDDQRIRTSLIRAQGTNTEAFNKANNITPINVPPAAVARDPGLLEPSELERNMELINARPALAGALLKDPEFASAIEPSRGYEGLARGYDDFSSSAFGGGPRPVFALAGETLSAASDEFETNTLLIEGGLRAIPQIYDILAGTKTSTEANDSRIFDILERQREVAGSTRDLPLIPRSLALGAGQLPFTVGALGSRLAGSRIGGAAGGVVAGTAFTAVVEGGAFFNQAMQDPDQNPQHAAAMSLAVGVVNGALENLSLGALERTLKGSIRQGSMRLLADKRFRDLALTGFTRAAIQMGTEGLTEFLQEVPQVLGESMLDYASGEISLEAALLTVISPEAIERYKESAEMGAIASAPISIMGSTSGYVYGATQAKQAKNNRDIFTAIADTSKDNSDLISQLPDRYKKLIDDAAEEGGSIEGIYIKPQILTDAYEADPAAFKALTEAMPNLADAMSDASAIDGKVRFSPGEFATYIAGSEQFEGLKNDLSFAEDQASPNEENELGSFEALNAVVERMKVVSEMDDGDPVTAREVSKDLAVNLEAIFNENLTAVSRPVAKRSAEVFSQMVSRIAQMDGQDPLETAITLLERFQTEQRPELDSAEEVARTDAFGAGADIFGARNEQVDLFSGAGESRSIGPESGAIVPGEISRLDATSPAPVEGSVASRFVQADEDGNVVGVLQVVAQDGRNATIANVFVDQEQRRQGVANALLARAREEFETVAHSDDLSVDGRAFAEADVFKQEVDTPDQATLTEEAIQPQEPESPFATPEDAEGRVRRKVNRKTEGRKYRTGPGHVINKRKTVKLSDGSNVTLGKQRPQDWVARIKSVGLTDEQIQNFRRWYYEVTGLFAATFGEDAPLFTAAWLIAQQNASPVAAMNNMLRVREQLINGLIGQEGSKKGGVAHERLVEFWTEVLESAGLDELATLAGSQKLYDFVDSALGKSTRTWMGDDPAGGEPGVIDVHTARDVGYVDETYRDRLIGLGASKRVMNNLTIDMKGAPTEAQYERSAEYLHEVRDYLNENEVFGGGFERVAEVQALGWMALLVQTGLDASSAQDALDSRTFQISAEAVFGDGAPLNESLGDITEGLSTEEIMGVTHSVVHTAMSQVAEVLGDPPLISAVTGTGAWMSSVNASTQLRFISSDEVAQDIAHALGYLLQQTEVWSGRELSMTSGGNWPGSANHWFVDVKAPGGELESDAARTQLFALILRQTGQPMGYSPIDGGFRVYLDRKGDDGKNLDWGSGNATKAQQALSRQILQPIVEAGKSVDFDVDVDYLPGFVQKARNDWTESSDGQGYLERFAERPAVQEQLRSARGAVEATYRTELDRRRGQRDQLDGSAAQGSGVDGQHAENHGRLGLLGDTGDPIALDELHQGTKNTPSAQRAVYRAIGLQADPQANTSESLKIYPLQTVFGETVEEVDSQLQEWLGRIGWQYRVFGPKSGPDGKALYPDFRDETTESYEQNVAWIFDPSEEDGSFRDHAYTLAWRVTHEIAHGIVNDRLTEKYGGRGRRAGAMGVLVKGPFFRGGEPLTLADAMRAVEWEYETFIEQRRILEEEFGITVTDDEFNLENSINMADAVYRATTGQFGNPGEMGVSPSSIDPELVLQRSFDVLRTLSEEINGDTDETLTEGAPGPDVAQPTAPEQTTDETDAAVADQNRRFESKKRARKRSVFKQSALHGTSDKNIEELRVEAAVDSDSGMGVRLWGRGLYFTNAASIARQYKVDTSRAGGPGVSYQGRDVFDPTAGVLSVQSLMQRGETELADRRARDAAAARVGRIVATSGFEEVSDVTDDVIEVAKERFAAEHRLRIDRRHDRREIAASQLVLDHLESLAFSDFEFNLGAVIEAEIPGPESLLDLTSEDISDMRDEHADALRGAYAQFVGEEFPNQADVGRPGLSAPGLAYLRIIRTANGSDFRLREISQYFQDRGVLGAKYTAETFSNDQGESNFVIWDDTAIEIQNKFYQQLRAGGEKRTRGQLVVDRTLHRFLLQISEGDVNDATLIHELGHLVLELVMDTAEQPGAGEQIQKFRDDVWEHLGVTDRTQITAEHHEKWAESLELYLREGKAPSQDLRAAFAFFRRRMMQIYSTLRGRLLNANHDMSMAPLFDRLLATDDAISEEASRHPIVSAFSHEQLELLPQRDRDLITKALSDAREEERERLERIVAREQDRVQKQQRSALRDEITADVMALPEQQMLYWLRRGTLPNGDVIDGFAWQRLSADAIDSITGGAEFRQTLPRGTWQKEGGIAPHVVAETFGYSSSEEMLDVLAQTVRPENIISERVQAESEALGLVATPEELREIAFEELEGPQRDRLYEAERRVARKLAALDGPLRAAEERDIEGDQAPTAAEARTRVQEARAELDRGIESQVDQAELNRLQVALAAATAAVRPDRVGRQDQAAARRNARLAPARIPTATFRAAARRVVGQTVVRDLPRSLRGWINARSKASRAKVDAAVRRDWDSLEELVDQEQLANAQAEVGATANQNVKKWRKALQSFDKKGSKKRSRLLKHATVKDDAGIETNYMDVIDGLLQLVSFRNISGRKIDNAHAILRFAERRADEEGITIPLPPWVEELREAPNYKEMTVQQLEELYTAVRALETQGMRLVREAEGGAEATEAMELAELRDQLATLKTHNVPKFGLGEWQGEKKTTANFLASIISFRTIADYLDQLNPQGPFHRLILHLIQDSAKHDRDIKKKASDGINKAWDKYTANEQRAFYHDRILIRGLGESLTKNEILAVAGQMGNEHNRAALRDSKVFPMSDETIYEILTHVTEKDADFLEAVTKILDSFWQEAQALEKRVNGVSPPKVEAVPWQLPNGRWMEGGYFPLDFNTEISERAHEMNEKNELKGLMPGFSGSPMTTHGHLKARRETSGGLTIRADFMSTVSNHITKVSKDTAWRETIIKLARYFKKLEPDLKPVIGNEFYRTLRPYLQRLSTTRRDEVFSSQWLSRVAGNARGGLGLLAMGWRITSAAIQASGFLPAMHRVGSGNVMAGYREIYLGNALKNIEEMRELVPALRDRSETFDRDAQREMLRVNPIDVRHPIRSSKSIKAFSMHYGYYMLGMIDTFTATAVAKGALRQALNGEVQGIEAGDMPAAIRYADGIIRTTQGSGETQDRSPIMDGNQVAQLFTTMMTYSNTQLQEALLQGLMAYEETSAERKAKRKAGVPTSRGRFLSFVMFTYVAAPIVEEIIRHSLKIFRPGPPPDEEEFALRVAANIAGGPMSGAPIAREFPGFFRGFGSDTAITDLVEVYGNVLIQTGRLTPFGESFDAERFTKAWANFGTYKFGLPTKAMITGYEVLTQEEFGRGR